MILDDILERRAVLKGDLIMQQGEAGDSAFLIQSGQVRVYADRSGQVQEVSRLWPGQIFGETALISGEKRAASAAALEDTTLLVLTRAVMDEKLRQSDPAIRAFAPMLIKRILQTSNALLSRGADIKSLREKARNVYDVVYAVLPQAQRLRFQSAVLPKLDLFLNAVKAFEEKYADQ